MELDWKLDGRWELFPGNCVRLFSHVDDGEAGEIMNTLQFFFMSDSCQSPELIGQQQVSSRYPNCDPGRV